MRIGIYFIVEGKVSIISLAHYILDASSRSHNSSPTLTLSVASDSDGDEVERVNHRFLVTPQFSDNSDSDLDFPFLS